MIEYIIKTSSNYNGTKLNSYNIYSKYNKYNNKLCKCCKNLDEVKEYINYMRTIDNVKPIPYCGYIIINIDIGKNFNPAVFEKFKNNHPNAKYNNIDLRKHPYYMGVIYNIYADEKDINTYKVYYCRYSHLYTKKRIARYIEDF